jgi:type II restriction enzyme
MAAGYKNKSQRARVLTENWMERNGYCPICGAFSIRHYAANRPVADFYCDACKSDFELKSKYSKSGKLMGKVVDGAYDTMIARITSRNNPNFFFMTYANDAVSNLLMVPNYFFVPAIIEKRKPLSDTARRAGWVGCNIQLSEIPKAGRIYMIRNRIEVDKKVVFSNCAKASRLQTSDIEGRGWLLDVLACIEKIKTDQFYLADVYAFENQLAAKYPNNKNIRAKIRQQLQLLRDRGFIEFLSRGVYRKIR